MNPYGSGQVFVTASTEHQQFSPSLIRTSSDGREKSKHPKLHKAWKTVEEGCNSWLESCKQTVGISTGGQSIGNVQVM